MQCNAREAMHLIELRSGPQGHPAYRRVAQQMHRAIAEQAGHHAHRRGHDLRRPRGRPNSNGSNPSAAPSAAARKNLQHTDQEQSTSSLMGGGQFPLTPPPSECVVYGAVPNAPTEPKATALDVPEGGML